MAATRRVVAAAIAATLGVAAPSSAQDRVTLHGVYFREASTRVVQPMVEVAKALPAGWDAGAYYLLDAITSASVAAGTAQDTIFTELRNEGGLGVGKTFGRSRLAASYRFSLEPDYTSQTVGLRYTHGVWENSGIVSATVAYGRDSTHPVMTVPKPLDVYFGAASYDQALSPTLRAQIGYDVTYLDGYFANPYVRHRNYGRENVPPTRLRHAGAARVAQFIPTTRTTFQLHYRFYVDQDDLLERWPWGMTAHTVEGRLYQELIPDHLELRLSYRYHSQGSALFFCRDDPLSPNPVDCYTQAFESRPEFYEQHRRYTSTDEKFGALGSHLPQAKLTWDLRIFRGVPFFRFFAPGWVELSYGYLLQETHYGNAHLLQTGYTLPF